MTVIPLSFKSQADGALISSAIHSHNCTSTTLKVSG